MRILLQNTFVSRLLRKASGLFVLNVVGAALAFLVQLLLTRVLGATFFGMYAYTMSWLNLLCCLAVLGHDTLLMRQVAVYRNKEDWPHLRGMLRHAQRIPLLAAAALAVVGIVIAWAHPTLAPELRNALTVALLLLPGLTLLRVRGSILCAAERPFTGLLPERLIRDTVMLALIGVLVYSAASPLTPATTVLLIAVGTGVALAVVSRALRHWISAMPAEGPPAYEIRAWVRAATVLGLTSGVQILLQRTDVLLIGWLRDTEQAGVYTVATSLSEACAFPIMAVFSIFSPIVAGLHARGEHKQMQDAVTATCRWSLFGTAAMALPLLIAPEMVLSFYGGAFSEAGGPLHLLIAMQLVRAALGPGMLLMMMVGNEAQVALILLAAALANIILNMLLIPQYGITGAALSSTVSAIAAQLLIARKAVLHTGIQLGPLSRPKWI